MEDDTPRKWQPKESKYTILMSDKTDFKPKRLTNDKDKNYVMVKGTIHQEDIAVINIYAPKIGTPKYIKQLLTDL